HENASLEFTRAAGFGNMRMDSLFFRLAEDQPEFKFKLPTPIDLAAPKPSSDELSRAHSTAVSDFISPEHMGYVKSRDAIAGFESHRIRAITDGWQNLNYSSNGAPKWEVTRLELVSLLRHDEPCVYVAKTMPAMDQLADVPMRPLNKFEKSALPHLAAQEDIVVDQRPDRILMLGALRAGTTCLECHEGERGKLLGAFSYEIVPASINAPISSSESAPAEFPPAD
ncbi:MAG TPA: hypothetical protein VHE81_08355, partial [Lacipirellulaceae bacterium]|nr:hypothetical protein [Lacipirellulaceae bacterium]